MTELTQLQQQLANAIRTPEKYEPANSDEKRRLAVYQSLFRNNIENFLENGFPVIHQTLPADLWKLLVSAFFAEHPCRSPYFADIGKEFVEYLSTAPDIIANMPLWLPELAHYEWLELDISIRKTNEPVCFAENGLLPDSITVSPLASLVSYEYPVHLIGPDFQSPEASDQRHYYMVFRGRDHNVEFAVINPLTARLVHLLELSTAALSLDDVVSTLADELPAFTYTQLHQGAAATVQDLLNKGALISAYP
ncbi:putative DNA-binding domain-containing protein [Alteromonas sp. ASW11-19]|uniref:DNA-binding domain-containing protein n=1 Tax=Alteromonas salexigens TaxID=2982530 RepID=A0ABT2VRS5_9ALTE|nr:putative DNA-binding domain-containing protein [Alteromonas salexigens]MCU7556008.1 putative DNA-binding domain-containing protein [Alteromonas salexigens]